MVCPSVNAGVGEVVNIFYDYPNPRYFIVKRVLISENFWIKSGLKPGILGYCLPQRKRWGYLFVENGLMKRLVE